MVANASGRLSPGAEELLRDFVDQAQPTWLSIALRDPATGRVMFYQAGHEQPVSTPQAFLSKMIPHGRIEIQISSAGLRRLLAQGGLDSLVTRLANTLKQPSCMDGV